MSESLPNSRDCFVCGVDNERGFRLKSRRDDGLVFASVTLPGWTVGFSGSAHGGIVATMLDEVMSWAANCRARGPTATGEMTVRYRRPTPVGESLRLEAEVTKTRGPVLFVEGRLLRGDGTPCATSTGKHVRVPKDGGAPETAFELSYAPGDSRIFED